MEKSKRQHEKKMNDRFITFQCSLTGINKHKHTSDVVDHSSSSASDCSLVCPAVKCVGLESVYVSAQRVYVG